MRHAEFAELGKREWRLEDHRGDVCGLSLTEDSLLELTADVAAEGGLFGAAHEATGMLLSCLENPATRTGVKVESGASFDMYQVNRPVPYAVLAKQGAGL